MRPSILPRRQLIRVCDACKRQRDYATARYSSYAAAGSPTSPRPAARLSQVAHRTTQSSIIEQSRCLSHSARVSQPSTKPQPSPSSSSSPPATAADHDDAKPEQSKREGPQTHYDFFPQTLPAGPPPAGPFGIDVRALRREFLALQASAHPDLHPAHLKRRAEAASARINEAFRTLESPLLRAQYVLGLRGLDVAGDETAKVEDPELLTLVLETREAIEDADDELDLEELKAGNDERVERSVERLERAFAEDRLEDARAEAVRLRYWINIRDSIHNWEKGKPVVLEH
ncbi:Co-chaperone Hsc20 [Xylariaceae sp. FL0662B]|nr:Co-chaperone Hsc20 [Xylariaceae sp. FL0662B]